MQSHQRIYSIARISSQCVLTEVDRMKVLLSELEKIVKEIPISYYCGYPISITVDKDADSSYYSPVSDAIVISWKQVNDALAMASDDCDKMSTARAFVYHEVSHSMITPKDLKMDDIVNIVEDERIERYYNNFYYGVNFKKNIYNVCGYKSMNDVIPSKNPKEAFFQLVRLGVGNPSALWELNKILNFHSPSIGNNSDYVKIIHNFYKKYFGNKIPEKREESCWISKVVENLLRQEPSMDSERIKKAYLRKDSSQINRLEDYYEFDRFFDEYAKRGRARASFAAYSGVFNPRELKNRDDYKFFNRPENSPGGQRFGTFHLNLFIDTSGSFVNNEYNVNVYLKALHRLSMKYNFFTYSVVSCGVGEKILKSHNAYIACRGGNNLDKEIYGIYRKLQKPETNVFNIVLFDGDAYSNCSYGDFMGGFGAFNHENCVIISDIDNVAYISKQVKKARVIYCKNYCEELNKEMINAMRLALSR